MKSVITRFKKLAIGDVYDFHGHLFIKLSNKYDISKSPAKQKYPNSLDLETQHYTVCSYNAIVTHVKSLRDFKP